MVGLTLLLPISFGFFIQSKLSSHEKEIPISWNPKLMISSLLVVIPFTLWTVSLSYLGAHLLYLFEYFEMFVTFYLAIFLGWEKPQKPKINPLYFGIGVFLISFRHLTWSWFYYCLFFMFVVTASSGIKKNYFKKMQHPLYLVYLCAAGIMFVIYVLHDLIWMGHSLYVANFFWLLLYGTFVWTIPYFIDVFDQEIATNSHYGILFYYLQVPSVEGIFSAPFLVTSLMSINFPNPLRFIMSNDDSKWLFVFLVVNLVFMFVELFYGLISNSLGLISDSIHMLFDCGALAIGLYGSYMSKWKNNHTFTFGYGRYQVLSGFVNGLLLLFIGVYISFEALHRFFDPPNITHTRLLPVSVIGLLINLSGVLIFKYASAHGEDAHHGHDHFDENLHGVFLHMVADTLSSVSLIISTLLIQYYELYIADAICSFIIAGIIFFASYPLIKHSLDILLLRSPKNYSSLIDSALEKLRSTRGVLQIHNIHFWSMNSQQFVGTLHIKVEEDVNEQELLAMINKEFSPGNVTCQIEKKKFLMSNNDKSTY